MKAIHKDTRVVVYGICDQVWNVADFIKECTLEESFEIVKEQWNRVREEDRDLYVLLVCETEVDMVIYSFNGKLSIREELLPYDLINDILQDQESIYE